MRLRAIAARNYLAVYLHLVQMTCAPLDRILAMYHVCDANSILAVQCHYSSRIPFDVIRYQVDMREQKEWLTESALKQLELAI